MKQITQGFSLIELIVTLAIVAVIMMIGIPNFNSAIRNSRLTTSVNELVTTFNIARSEAIKRNRHVVVGKTGTDWENGWQIFADVSRATEATKNVFDDNGDDVLCEATEDCLIKEQEALPAGYTLRPNHDKYKNSVSYSPNGIINAGGRASFYLCGVGGTVASGTTRVLILNAIGRPRMAVDDNNNGIPEKDSKDITSCEL